MRNINLNSLVIENKNVFALLFQFSACQKRNPFKVRNITKLNFFLFFVFALLMFANELKAQVGANQYSFRAFSGTYRSITGGTTVNVTGTRPLDDGFFNGISIPFTFSFAGTNYDLINVNTNGWITLGDRANPNNITASGFTNSFAALPNNPMLAALWDDLAISTNNEDISYVTSGSSPNRVLTIEFKNISWNYLATNTAIDFQIMLYETSNVIQFIYNPTSSSTNLNSASASIGIASANNNYLSLNNTGVNPTASSTSNTTSLTPQPAAGQVYEFTPPPPCSGTPTPGNTLATVTSVCASSGATTTLSLESYALNYTFQWQSSSTGTTGSWQDITGATGPTYTATPTATTFYRCNVTCTTSGLKNPSNPVQIIYDQSCILMPERGDVSTCSATFYDAGGPTGNYASNEVRTLTIRPSTLGASIQVTFNSFNTEANWDGLVIYNGSSIDPRNMISSGLPVGTGSAVNCPAGSFYGTTSPGTIISTAPDGTGALTFEFKSDPTVVRPGWDATVSCILPCIDVVGGPLTPGNTLATQTFVCSGNTTTLSMQTNYTGVTYQWQQSANGVSGWRNITGANASTYTPTVTTNIWYQCVVTCTTSRNTGTSTKILITSSACVDIIMPSTGRDSVRTCAGHFVDDGRANNYTNNANGTVTIYPATPGMKVRAVFSSFSTENNFDGLTIYNGNIIDPRFIISSGLPAGTGSAANCPAGSFYGTISPRTVTSTAADGSLTFVFKSDGVVNQAGWDATISCFSSDGCTSTPTPGRTLSNTQLVCSGGSANLSLQNQTAGANIVYQWQIKNGNRWDNLPGGNSSTYIASAITTPSYFHCVVSCGLNSGISDSIRIDIDPTCILIVPTGFAIDTACSGTFFDTGGGSGNYGDDENGILSIVPSDSTKITSVTFNAFSLDGSDTLKIYNGVGANPSNLIGAFTSSPGTVSSTDVATGGLTFEFISDGNINSSGWSAAISCLPKVLCTNGIQILDSILASKDTVCLGETTNLSINTSNLPLGLSYAFEDSSASTSGSWVRINTVNNPSVFATINDTVTYFRCVVKCTLSGGTDSSFSFSRKIIGVAKPVVTPSTNAINICDSGSRILTATITSGAGIIKWYSNTFSVNPVATGSSFTTPVIRTTTTYYVCATNGDCESIRKPVILNILLSPSALVLSPSGNPTICPDPEITTLSVSGGLSPDGVEAPVVWTSVPPNNFLYRDANAILSYVAGSNIREVYCKPPVSAVNTTLTYVVTAGTACPITDTVRLNLTQLIASVTIAYTPQPACDSATVRFTATPVNGAGPQGQQPGYRWFVNSTELPAFVGNVRTFPDIPNGYPYLHNGDTVKCIMAPHPSLHLCNRTNPESNLVIMNIIPKVRDSVSLTSSSNPICGDRPVTFTATPVPLSGGGINPTYQFYVNNVSQGPASISNTFTTSILRTGDVVKVKMNSMANCATPPSVFSNTITANVALIISPRFNQIPAVCAGGTFQLPDTSLNGIRGTWSPAINTSQTTRYTFTPSGGQCARDTFMDVAVNNATVPTFRQVRPVCSGSSLTLPLVSDSTPNSGITGTWTPAINNTQTTLYTFRPDTGQCAVVTFMNVVVYQNPTATITPVGNLCASVPINLSSMASSPAGILSYQWQSAISGSGPWNTITNANSSNYFTDSSKYYQVKVVDSNNCSSTSLAYQVIPIASGPMSGVYTIGAITANNVTSSGTTITINGTYSALEIGAVLTKIGGSSGGNFQSNTIITAINGNTITLNRAPTAPLVGDTIAGTTCTNFISFQRAIDSLNKKTINGNCWFNVTPGHTERLTKRLSLGNSNLNPTTINNSIVFRKFGTGNNPKINAYTGRFLSTSDTLDGIWSLDGVNNVTIDGIDLFDGNTASTSTMMEYGFGLFKAGGSDGAQRDTIKNCLITLNKSDTTNATGNQIFAGSVGIMMLNASSSLVTTAVGASASSGSNSRNAFYANTIQNCNIGIGLSGQAESSYILADTLNDVGGNSVARGNTISNFGGSSTTVDAFGIRIKNQWGVNVSFNNINNNTTHNGGIRGIYLDGGTSASASVNNNSVLINSISKTGTIAGIDNALGSTAAGNTLSISNNIVTIKDTFATSATIYAINQSAVVSNLYMNGNTVQDCAMGSSTGAGQCRLIQNDAASCANVYLNNNLVQRNVISSSFSGILATSPFAFLFSKDVSATVTINGNTIADNKKQAAPSPSTSYIDGIYLASSYNANADLSNNVIIGDTVISAVAAVDFAGIYAGSFRSTFNNNFIYNFGILNNVNNGSKMTVSGIRGALSFTLSNPVYYETISNNYVRKLFIAGTSSAPAGALNEINGIYSTSGTASYTAGLVGEKYISNNIIDSFYSRPEYTSIISGLRNAYGTNVNLYKNKIHSFFPGSAGSATGINLKVSGATTGSAGNISMVNISNNMVALDLTKAFSPASINSINNNNGLIGIDIGSANFTNFNVYNNSVRLSGTGNLTSNTFGSSGINHAASTTATTCKLNLKNNNIVNECSKLGAAGYTVAFRRSSGIANSLSNYDSTSNNNNFYAGIPSASNLIYYDGTSSAQTLAQFKAGIFTAGTIAPRDSKDTSVKPTFIDSSKDLHLLGRTGNNPALDSTGVSIVSINDDIDNEVRLVKPDIGADEFSALSFAGRVNRDTSICSGTSVTLVLESYAGTILKWQDSTSSHGWRDTAITTPTFTTSNLLDTTYFRAIVQYNSVTAASIPAKVSIKPIPNITLLGGAAVPSAICAGSVLQLNGTSPSAVFNPWVSASTGVASINNTGYVSAIASGSTQITYTNANGCSKTISLLVNPKPAISGNMNLCIGVAASPLQASGGTATNNSWISLSTNIATIDALTGIVTGIAPGRSPIVYTNAEGCSATDTVKVNSTPSITGVPVPFCLQSSASLTGSPYAASSGAWTSTNTAAISVSSTGFISAQSIGSATIRYTDINGCFRDTNITVKVLPVITGSNFSCIGNTVQLTGSPNPASPTAWTSMNTTIATVDPLSGLVTAVNDGFCNIDYKNDVGCTQRYTFTVYAKPRQYQVTGGGAYCFGSSPASIGLSSSKLGVKYQLMLVGSPADSMIGAPVLGTGTAIYLGSPQLTGTYFVTATDTFTTCSINMLDSTNIEVKPLPQGTFAANDTTCAHGPVSLTFTASAGVGPFTVVYNDGISNHTVNNIRSGIPFAVAANVTVTTIFSLVSVTDSNGCFRDAAFSSFVDTIHRSTYNRIDSVVCDSMIWHNPSAYLTATGVYLYPYTNGSGCPSTDTLHLQVNPTTNNKYVVDTCDYYTWRRNGTTYTSGGTYIYSYVNSGGCASVDTLELTLYQGTYIDTFITSCISYTWWNGQTYSVSGNYTRNYFNANGCASRDRLYLTIKNYVSWTGDVSRDWNDPNNWCGGVPSATTNVVIPSGLINYPMISDPIILAQCKNISVAANASVTFMLGGKLVVFDTLSIATGAIFDAKDGTLEMAGTSLTKIIPGGKFLNNNLRNLIINSAKDSLVGKLNLLGKLSFSGSNRLFATNNNLTLKSSDTLTSSVGNIFKDENTGGVISGNQITGDVIVERYLSSRKAWRLLTSPTRHNIQTIKRSWMENGALNNNPVPGFGIQITSNKSTWQADGFDTLSVGGPSVKTMDFSSTLWKGIDRTTNPFDFGRSYMTFVRGDRSVTSFAQIPTSSIIRETGRLFTGDTTLNLGTASSGRYMTVGNIYASAISLSNIAKQNLDNSYYLWDPRIAGAYGFGSYQTLSIDGNGNVAIAPGGGSYASGNVNLESGQGFLVRSIINGPASIGFKENNKVDGSNLVSRNGYQPVSFRTNLSKMENDQPSLYDGVLNIYDESSSDGIDATDAVKLLGTTENLSIKQQESLLSIERRSSVSDRDTIFYKVGQLRASTYSLNFIPTRMNTFGLTAYLEDQYLRTRIPVSLDSNSSVLFSVNSDSGSYASDRFRVVFRMMSALPISFLDVKAAKQEKNAKITWKVTSEEGIIRYKVERSLDGVHYTSIGDQMCMHTGNYEWLDEQVINGRNYYRIRSEHINGELKYSKVVSVLFNEPSSITLYPNPLKEDRVLHIKLQNKSEGSYEMKVINKLGQVVMRKEFYHTGRTGEYAIGLVSGLSHGQYTVEVKHINGVKSVMEFVY